MNCVVKAIVAASFITAGFLGCNLLGPSDDENPTCNFKDISLGTVTAGGGSVQATGTIDASDEITVTSVSVVTASGGSTSGFTCNYTDVKKNKLNLKDDLALKVSAASSVTADTYHLKIIAKVKDMEFPSEVPFTVEGGSTPSDITTITLEAGANQNSSLGSSIDLDGGSVWKMTDAASHVSEIDLCYSHTATNGDKVGSPYWAKESAFNYAASWSNPPQTKIVKVTMTSAEFDAVTTKAAIEAKFTGSGEISLTVVEGDVFVVKTTENAYALVRITAQTPGETGEITIKVAR